MPEMDYENRHKLKPHDFAILDEFGFKNRPVGFKFFNVESDLEGLGLAQAGGQAGLVSDAQGGATARPSTPTPRTSTANRESSSRVTAS